MGVEFFHAETDLPIMSPVVTICTASLTFNNSTLCPHSVCVLCGSENKQRLFPYTAVRRMSNGLCVWYQERTKFLYNSGFKLLHDAGSQRKDRSTAAV
jgi:hypothetical protein